MSKIYVSCLSYHSKYREDWKSSFVCHKLIKANFLKAPFYRIRRGREDDMQWETPDSWAEVQCVVCWQPNTDTHPSQHTTLTPVLHQYLQSDRVWGGRRGWREEPDKARVKINDSVTPVAALPHLSLSLTLKSENMSVKSWNGLLDYCYYYSGVRQYYWFYSFYTLRRVNCMLIARPKIPKCVLSNVGW